MKYFIELLTLIFNSIVAFVTTVSVLIGCSWVYYDLWCVHYGSPEQLQSPVVHWIASLSIGKQVFLFVSTPFASAIVGGLILGMVFESMLSKVWNKL